MRLSLSHAHLIVVLVTGCLIRLQWFHPDWSWFDARFMIHAHSHLALIGWLFPTLMMAAFESVGKRFRVSGLFHATVAAMFAAFVIQGYGTASIALSSVLLAWVSVDGVRFLLTTKNGPASRKRVWTLAVIAMLLSNIGPFALAGGAFMGPEWIRGWVTFYLHLQFSGWVAIAVMAYLSDSDAGLGWIALGLPLLLEPYFRSAETPLWAQSFGLAGGLATLAGTVQWIRSQTRFGFAHLALGLKAVAQVAGSLPVYGHTLLQTHYLGIAFAHLILLGLATHTLLTAPNRWFTIGTWGMIGVLSLVGLAQWASIPLYLPLQAILLGTGLTVLAGALITIRNHHVQPDPQP